MPGSHTSNHRGPALPCYCDLNARVRACAPFDPHVRPWCYCCAFPGISGNFLERAWSLQTPTGSPGYVRQTVLFWLTHAWRAEQRKNTAESLVRLAEVYWSGFITELVTNADSSQLYTHVSCVMRHRRFPSLTFTKCIFTEVGVLLMKWQVFGILKKSQNNSHL